MILLKEVDVIAAKKLLNLSPATFCNAPLISVIPYRNKPNAPKSVKIWNIILIICYKMFCQYMERCFEL